MSSLRKIVFLTAICSILFPITLYGSKGESVERLRVMFKEDRFSANQILARVISEKSGITLIASMIEEGVINAEYSIAGTSLITYSTIMGDDEFAEYLITKYSSDLPVAQKVKALEMACANERVNIVRLLADAGVNINSTVEEGSAPCIFFVIRNGDSETLKILMRNKVDLSLVNELGETPIEYLRRRMADMHDIEKLLVGAK